jgi:cytochrome P450
LTADGATVLSAGTQLRDYRRELLVARRTSAHRWHDFIDILLESSADEHRSHEFLAEQAVTISSAGSTPRPPS